MAGDKHGGEEHRPFRNPNEPNEDGGPKDEAGTPLGLRSALGDIGGGNPVAPDTPDAPGGTGGLREIFTDNLFKDTKNSVLTIVFGAVLLWAAWNAFTFVFLNTKTFIGEDGEEITRSGWEVVQNELLNYMIGPNFLNSGTSLTFVWIGVWLVALTLGVLMGVGYDPEADPIPLRRKISLFGAPVVGVGLILSMTETITPTLCVLVTVAVLEGARRAMRLVPKARRSRVAGAIGLVSFLVALGFWSGFEIDNFQDMGGLLLTFTVASVSITACFPIGVVMALARRSSFPLIRPFAVGYIELVRGVPLISLLFLAQFAIGFLLPPGTDEPPAIIRAIFMITLFSAAYVAEIVRGGLQSVPGGQVEAGQAVGLQALTITRRIVLPQALRNSIPPLIGQFISLLKDTTLLFIIGQRELLGATAPILGQPEYRFQGFTPEAYAFVAFVFWIICFTMSRASQRLETKLGVNKR